MSTTSVSTSSAEISRNSGTQTAASDGANQQTQAPGSINSIMNLIYPSYQAQSSLSKNRLPIANRK